MVYQTQVLLILNRIGYGTLAALKILLLLTFVSCSKEPGTDAAFDTGADKPVMSARNIDVLFSDSGKIQARLTGALMNRYAGEVPYMELPNGFAIFIYDSVRNVTTTITGNRGVRYDYKKIMEAWGNVVVQNVTKKEQLQTEHLIWDENKHHIFADGKVRITTPDKVLFGNQMESNDSFTDYSIIQVTGQMKVNRDSI